MLSIFIVVDQFSSIPRNTFDFDKISSFNRITCLLFLNVALSITTTIATATATTTTAIAKKR